MVAEVAIAGMSFVEFTEAEGLAFELEYLDLSRDGGGVLLGGICDEIVVGVGKVGIVSETVLSASKGLESLM